MKPKFTPALYAMALAAAACLPAAAQTPPKAAAPEGKTSSFGGEKPGAASSKVLTRDELRGCMQRLESNRTARTDLENRRSALDQEKTALQQEGDAIKASREEFEGQRGQAADLNARLGAHAKQVEALNLRYAALREAGNRASTREIEAAERDRKVVEAQGLSLEAERKALSATFEPAANAINTRVQAYDKRIAEWNERNRAFNDTAQKAVDEQEMWGAECAGRRFREDDEKAIKAGQ